MAYEPPVYKDSSEWVFDFLRGLPSPQRERGLAVYLQLIPGAQKCVLEDSTEILIDRDGQDYTDGPPLHWMVRKYPKSARVFSLGSTAYFRIVSKPQDWSRRLQLGEKRQEFPIFPFNGEPEGVYDKHFNPVIKLARLGYFVEGFAVGEVVDHRRGGIFTRGSVEIVDPVVLYSAKMEGPSLATSFQQGKIEAAWDAPKREIVLASLSELERKLRVVNNLAIT